ncbi:MAG: hypothetical protein HC923_08100 [Myxococcales bacterium]|nr:hypothetical protein [Myxococcales bacterium]
MVDDAYNANSSSLLAALDTIDELRRGAPFGVVLGEMHELGEHSRRLHEEGAQAVVDRGAAFLATLGPGARPAFEVARSSIRAAHDDDVDQLFGAVKPWLESVEWILLKGSRKARLERFLPLLEGGS